MDMGILGRRVVKQRGPLVPEDEKVAGFIGGGKRIPKILGNCLICGGTTAVGDFLGPWIG